MHLSSLRLYKFRNFGSAEINFCSGVNAILGDNGHGKTNLIEAIGLLGFAKSFRSETASELVSWGEPEGSVFGHLVKKESEEDLGVIIKNGRREALLNGNKLRSIEEFVGRLICVSFSPSDLSIVQGAPQERRRFLDKHLTEARPAMLRRLMDYAKALKNKNTILQEDRATLDTIGPWNKILSETGADIINSRINLLNKLEALSRGYQQRITSDDVLSLKLKSNVSADGGEASPEQILKILDENFQKERLRGQAIYGPHRDDIEISLGENNAGSFASQGQTRTIVLALKLGMIQLLEEARGESPIVLLDDVDSELDSGRRNSLFDLVLEQQRQVFITGTELRFLSENMAPKAQVYHVTSGSISEPEEA